jgi:hypothetical protein
VAGQPVAAPPIVSVRLGDGSIVTGPVISPPDDEDGESPDTGDLAEMLRALLRTIVRTEESPIDAVLFCCEIWVQPDDDVGLGEAAVLLYIDRDPEQPDWHIVQDFVRTPERIKWGELRERPVLYGSIPVMIAEELGLV